MMTWRVLAGVLQYLGVRLFTMLLTFVLENLDLYGEGDYSVKKGFFWVTILNCSSQTWCVINRGGGRHIIRRCGG